MNDSLIAYPKSMKSWYIKNEEEEKMDNLPENLQNSIKYEEFEAAVEALDDAPSSITEACDTLEELFNNA